MSSSSSSDSVDVSRGCLEEDWGSNAPEETAATSSRVRSPDQATVRQRRGSSSSFSSGVPSEIDDFAEDEPMDTTGSRHIQGEATVRVPRNYQSRASARNGSASLKRPTISVAGFADEQNPPTSTGEVSRKKKHEMPGPGSKEMCKLVVDYLISEGYKEAAEILCSEAKMELPVVDIQSLDSRVEIRDAIIEGNIDDAIQKVTDICPGLMDDNREVRFHLLLQNIIEMIRNKDTERALSYAQEHLAGDRELSEEQLTRMEKTFALLAFETPEESPFNVLLSQSQRQMVSTEVNSAVLHALNRPAAPRLEALLRMVVWAQSQLLEGEGSMEKQDTVVLARSLFRGTQI